MYIEMQDRVKIFLGEKGQGEPCLFIHGGPKHYKKWIFPNAKVKILNGKHVLYLEQKEKL